MTPFQKPAQQAIRSRVLSGAGWLEGTFHVTSGSHLVEYLNQQPFYALTDVGFPEGIHLSFFALARSETFVVEAPADEPPPSTSSELITHHATFVFPVGVVDAQLELAPDVRLSD